MSISIIMPVYNAAPYLAEAYAALLAQSHTAWELIVVDDGSTDTSLTIVQSWADPRVKIITNAHNQGAAAARNLGTAAARYDLLHFLDADDVLRPDALARLYAAASAHPQAGVIYGAYQPLPLKRRLPRRRPQGDVLRAFLRQNRIANAGCALIRRAALAQVGGWNAQLKTNSDWALWILLAAVTPFVALPGAPVLSYRTVETGLTLTHNTSLVPALAMLDIVYAHPLLLARLPEQERKKLRAASEAHALTQLARQALRRHAMREALSLGFKALRRAPQQAPRTLARLTVGLLA